MCTDGATWFVVWECEGIPCFIDSDCREGAHVLAARLAETGRERVRVIGPRDPEPLPPDVSTRLRERLARMAKARGPLAEAAGVVS
jgi:DNA-binding LacI/PurR family transcriptional regulator